MNPIVPVASTASSHQINSIETEPGNFTNMQQPFQPLNFYQHQNSQPFNNMNSYYQLQSNQFRNHENNYAGIQTNENNYASQSSVYISRFEDDDETRQYFDN